jgi:intracellular sulfur oxidation DsrE/DsrF family protein
MRQGLWTVAAACVVCLLVSALPRGFRGDSAGASVKRAAKYRAVIDASVDGAERWDGIIRNIENMQRELGAGNVEIEVVVYGKAWPLGVKAEKGGAADFHARVDAAVKSGVKFALCENTMRRTKLVKEDLMPFMATVPSGVSELVRKQAEGWAYLKPGP